MRSKEFLDTIEITGFIPGNGKKITTTEMMNKISQKYNKKRTVIEDPDLKGNVFATMTENQFEKYMLKRYRPFEEDDYDED